MEGLEGRDSLLIDSARDSECCSGQDLRLEQGCSCDSHSEPARRLVDRSRIRKIRGGVAEVGLVVAAVSRSVEEVEEFGGIEVMGLEAGSIAVVTASG